jgi:hypothetical protein
MIRIILGATAGAALAFAAGPVAAAAGAPLGPTNIPPTNGPMARAAKASMTSGARKSFLFSGQVDNSVSPF